MNQLKFIYSEKATKILRNLLLAVDYSTYGQKLGEDFAKFCGLLRIYELYSQGICLSYNISTFCVDGAKTIMLNNSQKTSYFPKDFFPAFLKLST